MVEPVVIICQTYFLYISIRQKTHSKRFFWHYIVRENIRTWARQTGRSGGIDTLYCNSPYSTACTVLHMGWYLIVSSVHCSAVKHSDLFLLWVTMMQSVNNDSADSEHRNPVKSLAMRFQHTVMCNFVLLKLMYAIQKKCSLVHFV